jgi:phosphatidylglycerol:prolipoprotein diacylglycerol transferase
MQLFQTSYVLFVGLGIVLALLFPVTKQMRNDRERRQYYLLQGITLAGAVIGAKVSVLIGDHHWPWVAVEDWGKVLESGRSITGALLFGFLFAELAKPLVRYELPPNDRFAALLPFSIGIGRIGCLQAGCCGGIPCQAWFALPGTDGVLRYPTQLFEIIFQFAAGGLFVVMVRRGRGFGRLFSIYLVMYGVFRFFTEFIRDTPKFFGGWSGYQLLALVMIALGTAFWIKRTVAPPAAWRKLAAAGGEQAAPAAQLEESHV